VTRPDIKSGRDQPSYSVLPVCSAIDTLPYQNQKGRGDRWQRRPIAHKLAPFAPAIREAVAKHLAAAEPAIA